MFLQTLAQSSTFRLNFLRIVTEVAVGFPAASRTLPFVIVGVCYEPENFRCAVGHHVEIGDAGDRYIHTRRVIVLALENLAESTQSLAADVDYGNTVFSKVRAGKLGECRQQYRFGVALDDEYPVSEKQIRLGDIKKPFEEAIVSNLKPSLLLAQWKGVLTFQEHKISQGNLGGKSRAVR